MTDEERQAVADAYLAFLDTDMSNSISKAEYDAFMANTDFSTGLDTLLASSSPVAGYDLSAEDVSNIFVLYGEYFPDELIIELRDYLDE